MQFATSRPDIVRSVTQRWLHKYWCRLRAARVLPLWKDLPTEELLPQVDTLLFCDVVAGGARPRFLIRHLGRRLAEAYGGDRRGEYLDDVLPPVWRDGALATYRIAVEAQKPVYNVVPTGDREGREVHMERLLLPFSHDGLTVDRILASIETVSIEGRFEQQGLATSPHIKAGCEAVCLIDETAPATAA